MTAKALFEKLEKTQAQLKKFSGVNKKAIEQYSSFTEQRAELQERKQGQTNAQRESITSHTPLHSPRLSLTLSCCALLVCVQSWMRVASRFLN